MKSFGRFWRFIENMLQVFSNMFDFALMLLLSIESITLHKNCAAKKEKRSKIPNNRMMYIKPSHINLWCYFK